MLAPYPIRPPPTTAEHQLTEVLGTPVPRPTLLSRIMGPKSFKMQFF